jgi:uncharacterized membrane protein
MTNLSDLVSAFDLAAWLGLALRWLHVIAGIAWIGASFYFVWLDNSLTAPDPPREGVKGELWAVHGGGFYQSQKYMVAPAHLPGHLHWFKWEAYTTWLSGFALLCLVYYWGARDYLIDPAKAALSPPQAIAIGLGFILGGLAVYEALCRSPLVERPRLFGAIWFAVLTAAAFALTHLFSDRGAFLHGGAIIGTVMVANVFLVIIPNQAKIVAAMRAGAPVDPRLGAAGKQRSVHNNYMTLPVVFIMISHHYPAVTGGPLNWLWLSLICAAGVSVRHFFNLRHVGRAAPEFLLIGALLFLGVAAGATAALAPMRTTAPPSFAEANAILRRHCVMCHSASPTHAGFSAPPGGVVFDSPEHIAGYAPRIWTMAVMSETMPLGNETGMTPAERAKLGAWIKAGAKTR